MTGENRLANARSDIATARDEIRLADAAVSIGVLRGAMSRAYYAVFHACRALLLLEGMEAKTHAGLHRLVAEHLVRGGKTPPSTNLLLAKLQGYRQAADYAYTFDIAELDAKRELDEARAFVETAAATVAAFAP
jgi:uncharacterized protein